MIAPAHFRTIFQEQAIAVQAGCESAQQSHAGPGISTRPGVKGKAQWQPPGLKCALRFFYLHTVSLISETVIFVTDENSGS